MLRKDRNTDPRLELLVTAEQAQLLFNTMPAGIGGAMFSMAILAFLLWGSHPAPTVILWALLVAIPPCGVLVVDAGYRRAQPDAQSAVAWDVDAIAFPMRKSEFDGTIIIDDCASRHAGRERLRSLSHVPRIGH